MKKSNIKNKDSFLSLSLKILKEVGIVATKEYVIKEGIVLSLLPLLKHILLDNYWSEL